MAFHSRIPSLRADPSTHPVDVELGWTLSDQAAIAQDLADLRQRLESMPVIEQAKGVLMSHYGIDADTAFAVLRRWSSHTNLKLRVISRMVVDAATEPGEPGTDHPSGLVALVDELQHVHPGRTNPLIAPTD